MEETKTITVMSQPAQIELSTNAKGQHIYSSIYFFTLFLIGITGFEKITLQFLIYKKISLQNKFMVCKIIVNLFFIFLQFFYTFLYTNSP